MGPRPLSHGNEQPETNPSAEQTWMLQWGRDLSVTETRPHRPFTTPGLSCFNGAATSQSRKLGGHGGHDGACSASGWASMGPRPLSHGNPRTLTPTRPNPAVFRLQWGRDLSVTETSVPVGRSYLLAAKARFNGAATSQSRKPGEQGVCQPAWRDHSRLQWGRDLSVTETCPVRPPRLYGCASASMGPRPLSHGNSSRDSGVALPMGQHSFNGAATSQSRKRLTRTASRRTQS